ncbi:MAG: ABC transporter ATP-binding protein [Bacilli bacterium]
MNNIVDAFRVSKEYGTGSAKTLALKDASFFIEEGSFTVILGPSGAGKTTLLNLLGGMDRLTSGHLRVGNTDLASLQDSKLTDYRRIDVGFVFQFYNLMPNLTAKENVELAVEVTKNAFDPEETLKQVGLEKRENFFPSQLSGGEQQRVSIARAIAKNPKLLLCDEPTGALDYETGKTVLKLLDDYSKNNHKTVIIVTHNAAIREIADHVIRIRNGMIVADEHNDNKKKIEEISW